MKEKNIYYKIKLNKKANNLIGEFINNNPFPAANKNISEKTSKNTVTNIQNYIYFSERSFFRKFIF
jgi:hypothetical protein